MQDDLLKLRYRCAYKELVDFDTIKLNPLNTNEHSDDQVERLAQTIRYNGWRAPIRLTTRSNEVMAGEGRILAAKWLNRAFPGEGWNLVPVDYQDYDSEDHEFADMNADNNLNRWHVIDFGKLNEQLPNLSPDFDMKFLGLKNDFSIEPSEKPKKEQKPKMVLCPSCSHEFDANKASSNASF